MDFLFVVIILIMSVVIHEVAHGYAALALGDSTAKYQGRLTLNPIRHLDLVGSILMPLIGYFAGGFIIGWAKPVPFNPYNLRNAKWGEALVALAGPASNIAIAFIFSMFLRFGGFEFQLGSFEAITSYVILINLTLAVFNLVPIPPLDGSKILFALLPLKLKYIRETIEKNGFILVIVFVFFLWQFVSPIVFNLFSLFTGIGGVGGM